MTTEVTLTFVFHVNDIKLVPMLIKDMILLVPEEQLSLGGMRANMKFRAVPKEGETHE